MKVRINLLQAVADHPNEVAAVMAKLARGRSREKGASAADLAWSLEWCVGMGGFVSPFAAFVQAGSPVPAGIAGISLSGAIGAGRGSEPLPVGPVPRPIADAYAKDKAPKPIPEGAMVLRVRRPTSGDVDTLVVVGAYEKRQDGETRTVVVDERRMIHTIVDGRALFSGGLRPKAVAAFDGCPPGGTFRWRNKPMRRLAEEETRAILATAPTFEGGVLL